MKALTPNGYDVIMASEMLGHIAPTAVDQKQQNNIKLISDNTPVSYTHLQNTDDLLDEKLKNNLGLKFAFRSTDINEINKTLAFFGVDLSLIHFAGAFPSGFQTRTQNQPSNTTFRKDRYIYMELKFVIPNLSLIHISQTCSQVCL